MKFHVVTLFPEVVRPYLKASILGRAQRDKKIKISYYNPRDFTSDKWKRVDQRPYGGGPGMVLEAESILKAAAKALAKAKKPGSSKKAKIILFNASGKQFTNTLARSWAKKYTDIVLIAGRYEGVDARVKKILKAEEVSVGPFVLTGGEVPAMVVVDAICRQLPGILGNKLSIEEERLVARDVYTRPEVLTYKGKKYRVPKVLLSGHHGKILQWKEKKPSRRQ